MIPTLRMGPSLPVGRGACDDGGMARSILSRWESLPPRRQIQLGIPLAFLVLFAVHEAFFPNLTLGRTLGYALMESVPLALVVTYATQVELARRAQQQGQEPGASVGGHDAGAAGIDMDAMPVPDGSDTATGSGNGHGDE